jgi:hypothetical protein
MKLTSGGQTGADQAALQWALEKGLEIGGWCPKGRKAEDGTIPECSSLKETPTATMSSEPNGTFGTLMRPAPVG